MVLITQIKDLIGYYGNDYELLFIFFAIILLLYMISFIFGMFGNIFK